MYTDMNLNIQDYFKRSGINRSVSKRNNGKNTTPEMGNATFSRTLTAMQSAANSEPNSTGLSIRDYAARAVTAKGVYRSYPTAPKLIPPQEKENFDYGIVAEKEQILASIDKAAKKYDLPPALIRAVVQAESDFQVRAVSPAGAQGLMQLMPATAKELGVRNPFNIDQNIEGGAKYLRNMLNQFNGDIRLALSAYNAGPGTVAKYNGNVPYAETRNYVDRVMRFSRKFA